MRLFRVCMMSVLCLHGVMVPVWSQTEVLGTTQASEVKLRSAMTSQFATLQARLTNGKAVLQAIKTCHEGSVKQYYGKINAMATPRCFDPVAMMNGASGTTVALTESVIEQSYREYLGRDAGNSEIAYWQNSGRTDADLLNHILYSEEARTNETRARVVQRAYREYLGREAAVSEVATWVATDKNPWDLRRAVIESPEAASRAIAQ